MIIIHDHERNVTLPTFEQLIEKIKQNEKSKRSKKNKNNNSDEDYKDDDNDDNGEEEEEINLHKKILKKIA